MVNVALAGTEKTKEKNTTEALKSKVTKNEKCYIKSITKKSIGEFITTKEQVVPVGSELVCAGAYAQNGEIVFFATVNTGKVDSVVNNKEYDAIVYFTEEVKGWVLKNAEKSYTKKELIDVIYEAVNTMIEKYNQ